MVVMYLLCCVYSERLFQHDAEEHVCLHRTQRRRSKRTPAEWEGQQVRSPCPSEGRAIQSGDVSTNIRVSCAPVQPPHPLRGQQVDPPPIASVVEQPRLSELASLEGRQAAAPSTVASFENVAPPPTTAPLPRPVCHMTPHPSPSHDLEDPPTCSPNSPPGSPAGMQSCSSESLL